jgi:hypothetical protein
MLRAMPAMAASVPGATRRQCDGETKQAEKRTALDTVSTKGLVEQTPREGDVRQASRRHYGSTSTGTLSCSSASRSSSTAGSSCPRLPDRPDPNSLGTVDDIPNR